MTGTAQERLLSTFLDLVRIDSPSKEEALCADYCKRELEAVGFTVTFDDSAAVTGSDTGNLIAELRGDAPGKLVLSAHLDTVEPGRGIEPVIADGYIFSAGQTVLGADDKSGIAAAIECARRLVESGESRPTLRCVFTVQEEVGLLGAKALPLHAAEGDLCLVLDADGRPGGIIVAAPTHYTFKAVFFGKAAHAGVSPEKGVSAITMAADAISGLELGRLDENTTANVGSIEGGRATNVVAPRVEITGECRSLVRTRVDALRESMEATMRSAAEKHGGQLEIVWQLEYEGFSLSEDDPVVTLVAEACRRTGLEPRTARTGGGSDANVIAALGIPTVALSCGMQGVHGVDEQIALEDLESLTELCVEIARGMARTGEAGA